MSQIPTLTPPAPSPAVTPPLMTADEFMRRHANDRAELVNGVVKDKPMPSFKHSKICATFTRLLGNFVAEHDLGHVGSNDSQVRLSGDPALIRAPDVCFFSYERLPRGDVPEGVLTVIPDLAAEMRSPSDSWSDVFTKVIEYLKAGVRVVLVFDAATKTASAYRDTELQRTFHANEELTIPDVLPGFSVRVGTLFE
jgi:Uma2 family endonuclease